MRPLPFSAADLIEELDKQNPARCIKPDETLELAHRYAGKRELIDNLLARLQVTEKKGLTQMPK